MERIENFEFIAKVSPAPDDAKRKVAKTQGPDQGARYRVNCRKYVAMKISRNAESPVEQC